MGANRKVKDGDEDSKYEDRKQDDKKGSGQDEGDGPGKSPGNQEGSGQEAACTAQGRRGPDEDGDDTQGTG